MKFMADIIKQLEDERILTPRGTFRMVFSSLKEAEEVSFHPWFWHDGFQIVSDGTLAFAVRSRR